MTPAQLRVLVTLAVSPVTDAGLTIMQIRSDVLRRLQLAGWVKYRPYGSPPSWVITAEGREKLKEEGILTR